MIMKIISRVREETEDGNFCGNHGLDIGSGGVGVSIFEDVGADGFKNN